MSFPNWPDYEEVGALMVSAGLIETAPEDDALRPYIEAAIADLEKRTGYKPFLEEGVAQSYYYNGPQNSPVLDLRAGFTSITAVAIAITYDDDTGTALVANQDYVLEPIDARQSDQPYTEIRFLRSVSRGPRSIKVTGKRGYDDEIDAAVWLAVARKAACLAIEDLTVNQGADLNRQESSIEQGPVTIKYEKSTVAETTIAKWAADFQKIVRPGSGFVRMVI